MTVAGRLADCVRTRGQLLNAIPPQQEQARLLPTHGGDADIHVVCDDLFRRPTRTTSTVAGAGVSGSTGSVVLVP